MQLLDDSGNLFGLVNLIDVFVVMLVLAVGVAGASLVFNGGESTSDPATANFTLDLGNQPEYIVTELNEGDSYSPTDNTELTITDIHFAPRGTDTRAIARFRLQGEPTSGSINFDGAPLRLGRHLRFPMSTYEINGTIRDIGGSESFTTKEVPVVIRTTIPKSKTEQMTAGEEIRVAGRPVATINDIAVYDTDDSRKQVAYVHTTLRTLSNDRGARFGNIVLRQGATVELPTDDVVLEGQIQRVGSPLDRGTTQVLVTDTVSTERVTKIDEGDTYRIAGRTVGTVASVTAYGTNNPGRKRVYVGLELITLQHGELPRFGTIAVREGTTIPFNTPEYELSGTVQRIGTTEQPGQASSRTVTLQIQNVSPDFAESIKVGATETTAETTVARITSVNRTSSSVILTSQDGNIYERDHPVNRDITFEANLTVRETTTGTTFKGDTIQRGSTITLDLGDVTIRATVVSL